MRKSCPWILSLLFWHGHHICWEDRLKSAEGLAGMELTFFVAAAVVLCFGLVAGQCWQHTSVLAIAAQPLPSVKALSFPHSATAASRQGVGKRLWGDAAGAADPDWPKKCSVPCNVMLSNTNWGRGRRRFFVWFLWRGRAFLASKVAVVWRQAGNQSTCGRWWVISFVLLFFLQLLKFLYLDPQVFLPFLWFSSPSCWWGWGKQSTVWVLAGVNTPQNHTESWWSSVQVLNRQLVWVCCVYKVLTEKWPRTW